MLKKLLCFLLLFSFLISGCSSNKTIKKEKSETVSVDDLLSYEIYSLDTVNKLRASQPSSSGLYYEPQDKSKVFLDLTLEMTNNTTKELEISDLLDGTKYIIDKNEYAVSTYVETDSMTSISAYGSILPQETTFVHLVTEVNESTLPEDITINLVINDNQTEIILNRDTLKPKITTINMGEKLIKENIYEVTYVESYLTKKVEPTQPNDFYSYYESDMDKTYAVAKYKIKNLNSTDIDADEVLATRVIVDGKYEYTGFNVIEKEGNLSIYEPITPMTEVYVYTLIDIPDSIIDKSIEFHLATAGETRTFELSKK